MHSDDPADTYVEADVVVRGSRIPPTRERYGPELYQRRLLDAVPGSGWVVFVDDDDEFTRPDALSLIVEAATDPDAMVVWKVERPNRGVRPKAWMDPDLSAGGKLCWENAAFHTKHLQRARDAVTCEHRHGDDWRFWRNLSLPIAWLDEVLVRPQLGDAGKGEGLRRDRSD